MKRVYRHPIARVYQACPTRARSSPVNRGAPETWRATTTPWQDNPSKRLLRKMFLLYRAGQTVPRVLLCALAKWIHREHTWQGHDVQNQICRARLGLRLLQCWSMKLRSGAVSKLATASIHHAQ